MRSLVVVPSGSFYVAGAMEGDLVCPECQSLPRNGSLRSQYCHAHGTKHVALVPYKSPTTQRRPDNDESDRE